MKWENLTPDLFNAMDEYKPENRIPFEDRKVTMIVFSGKEWRATKSWQGKVAFIKNAEKSDIFLLAWTGQYSTNIFPVTMKQIKELTKGFNI